MAQSSSDKKGKWGSLLGLENVGFSYDSSGWKVKDLCLYIQRGQKVGVLGGNESGKTTIGRLFKRTISPTSGRVVFGEGIGNITHLERVAFRLRVSAIVLGAVAFAGIALMVKTHLFHQRVWWLPELLSVTGTVLVLCLSAVLGMVLMARHRNSRKLARYDQAVLYLNSEDNLGQKIDPSLTIEQCLVQHVRHASPDAARKQAIDDLSFCGFRMYDQQRQPWGSVPEYFEKGIQMKQLSGGQRHLVYLLGELARRPRFVVCDEILCGLDILTKTRFLQLLLQRQKSVGFGLLYMTCEMDALEFVSDRVHFLDKDASTFSESAPTKSFLKAPSTAAARTYVRLSREMARGGDPSWQFRQQGLK